MPGRPAGMVLRLVFGVTLTLPGSPARQGRFFLGGILLLYLDLAFSICSLIPQRADLLLLGLVLDVVTLPLSLCIVRATYPGFVALTGAPGPGPNALPGVVGAGPIQCTGERAVVACPFEIFFASSLT